MYLIGSKGRMLALLKEKSQVGVASKPRKKFEAYMPKKKPNPPDD